MECNIFPPSFHETISLNTKKKKKKKAKVIGRGKRGRIDPNKLTSLCAMFFFQQTTLRVINCTEMNRGKLKSAILVSDIVLVGRKFTVGLLNC